MSLSYLLQGKQKRKKGKGKERKKEGRKERKRGKEGEREGGNDSIERRKLPRYERGETRSHFGI